MRTRRRFISLSLVVATSVASADPLVELVDRAGAPIVLDGVLREWSGTLAAVDDRAHVVEGASEWHGADDASFAFSFARDDAALYVAAEVRDDRVVRTREHRADDDALVVTAAFQNGRAWMAWEVALQPGEPGSYPGAVRWRVPRDRGVPGAQVVEAPLRGASGFTLEARIPWAVMPGLREHLSTARIRVAYLDSDQEAHPVIETVIANGGGDAHNPMDLPPTVASAPAVAAASVDLLERFRREHSLAGVRPLLDRRIDVIGTPAPERVVVFPRHVVTFGPAIAGGTTYTFLEFPSGEVVSAQLVDVTGDRKAELAITLRATGGSFERTLLHVYSMDATGTFQRVFAQEVGRREGANRLTDAVRYQGSRVHIGPATVVGYTAATWPAASEAGVEAPLTTWGAHRSEVFAWSAATRSFALETSVPNPTVASVTANETVRVETPVELAQPGADVEGALRLFMQREHVPEGTRPSFRATGDAAEDPAPEQFYIYGRTLVVVGPRYMGGRAYSSIELPANPGDEVVALRAADITDDGHVEAVVSVRRHVSVQVQGAANTSERVMVFAYSFAVNHHSRVFAAELSRRVGSNAVESRLTLPQGARGNELTIESMPAVGWTQATYPFHDDVPQGYEALLLPWGPSRRVTWRWNGTAMVRVP